MSTPRIVVTGASGQLGQTLSRLWAEAPLPGYEFLAIDRSALDISDSEKTTAVLAELSPDILINAAAYTMVDGAESDSQQAYLINEQAPARLATWAAENGASLIHISTDFVFDGSATEPYQPGHETAPLGVYGASKLAGERRIAELADGNSAVVRTSWLYSECGNNFVKTMLRLMAEKEQLSVVNDQIGSPTSTHSLAELLFAMITGGKYDGIYHWTDGGSISWFDFAVEIQSQAVARGLLDRAIPIHPITTREYPTPARRPAYSVLDCDRAMDAFDCPDQHWQARLGAVLELLQRAH